MHHEQRDPELFPSAPLSVWREVYNGRWGQLRRIQRVEFIVEVIFFFSFAGVCIYGGYVERGSLMPFVIGFLLVGLGLVTFFCLLTRSIH